MNLELIARSVIILIFGILAVIFVNVPRTRKGLFAAGLALAVITYFLMTLWWPDAREALNATATVVVAGTAILAIFLNRQQREDAIKREKRDRKERLLNEIIEWAIDISKWRPKEIHKDLVGIRNKMNRQELIDAHIATIMDNLIEMRGRNQYIFRIALKVVEQLGKAATQNLIKEVHNLIGEVQEYIDFLAEWKAIITKAMAKDAVVDDGGYFEKAEHSEYELEKSVKKVIDEATNLY